MLIALLVHFQRFAACEVRQTVANATVARPDIRFDPLEKGSRRADRPGTTVEDAGKHRALVSQESPQYPSARYSDRSSHSFIRQ